MHTVIRAIVYAENENDALCTAKELFDSMVERNVFDYYVNYPALKDGACR